MKVNAHLTFAGRCELAFKFYEEVLGARITLLMTHKQSPSAADVPDMWADKVLHATLALGDQVITGADVPPDEYQEPQGFSVQLNLESLVEAERVFSTLAEQGETRLPLRETFWALRFGMVVDQFGTPWIINCGDPARGGSEKQVDGESQK